MLEAQRRFNRAGAEYRDAGKLATGLWCIPGIAKAVDDLDRPNTRHWPAVLRITAEVELHLECVVVLPVQPYQHLPTPRLNQGRGEPVAGAFEIDNGPRPMLRRAEEICFGSYLVTP